jgi:hypothetical protein
MSFWKTSEDFVRLSRCSSELQGWLRGVRFDNETLADESDYYMVCPECGQAIDERSLYQILHHHESGHDPLTDADLSAVA